MPKIIDCFLFFQELDLLEIRLRYLYDSVDQFVILEASQAFSGKAKPFVFEEHAERFAPFADKICYFKLDEFHGSFEDVCGGVRAKTDPTSGKILHTLQTGAHINRNELHWVLEEYHRECLLYPLGRVAAPNDLILFSDLDELPTLAAIQAAEKITASGAMARFVCDEFDYFVNWFKMRGWLGPGAGRWSEIESLSLNGFRRQLRASDGSFQGQKVERGGWHFTSCGGLEAVERKIESWGHQEFNTGLVKSRLQTNIRYGRDVFFRGGHALKYVDVRDAEYFDAQLQAILADYPHLIAAEPEKEGPLSALQYQLDRARFKALRLSQKLHSAVRHTVKTFRKRGRDHKNAHK